MGQLGIFEPIPKVDTERVFASSMLRSIRSPWPIPKEVRLRKLWTKIPPPSKVKRGFDPTKLRLSEGGTDIYRCDSIPHGQLPNELRERYGFPLRPEDEFRDVRYRIWWDRKQSEEKKENKKRP